MQLRSQLISSITFWDGFKYEVPDSTESIETNIRMSRAELTAVLEVLEEKFGKTFLEEESSET